MAAIWPARWLAPCLAACLGERQQASHPDTPCLAHPAVEPLSLVASKQQVKKKKDKRKAQKEARKKGRKKR